MYEFLCRKVGSQSNVGFLSAMSKKFIVDVKVVLKFPILVVKYRLNVSKCLVIRCLLPVVIEEMWYIRLMKFSDNTFGYSVHD